MRGPSQRRRRVAPLVLALVLLLTWSCQPPPEPPPPEPAAAPAAPAEPQGPVWLEDVAQSAGIDFVHVRGRDPSFLFPEIMGSGAAWLDYDGDGHLDLYVVQSGELDGSGPGNVLYRNEGDGTFTDVTAAAGVGDTGYGMGAAVGDYDGDGAPDLYVTSYGPNVLYRNEGDGTFTDVSRETGVGDRGWGVSAAFFDGDGDGDLDLFIVNYAHWAPEREIECRTGAGQLDYCGPAKYNAPAQDVYYRNEGEGRFRRWSAEVGIEAAFGYGLGIAVADFNLDGHLDVFVANDTVANQLWMNQGGGTFRDEALLSGSAVNMLGVAEAGMGVSAFDYQDDGDVDLFVSHLWDETNTLYVNQDGFFEDATVLSGLATPSLPMTGFGQGFVDFDHDGELDLFVANGKVRDPDFSSPGDPYADSDQLFRGTGGGRFAEVPGGLAVAEPGSSRGAAFADYDNDGDVDVAVVQNGGRLTLYENKTDGTGHSLLLRVVDRRGLLATGAQVAATAGARTWWRLVGPTWSYASSNDPRVHVGLGAATAAEVVVVWRAGRRESFGRREAGSVHVLREGEGESPGRQPPGRQPP